MYQYIYEELFSKTWSPNLALELQSRFLDWRLSRFGKDFFKWFIESAEPSKRLVLIHPNPQKLWTIECDSSLLGSWALLSTQNSELYPTEFLANGYNMFQLEAVHLAASLNTLSSPDLENYSITIIMDKWPPSLYQIV